MQLAPTYLCSLGNLGDTRMFGERGEGQERYARARRARSKTSRANHYQSSLSIITTNQGPLPGRRMSWDIDHLSVLIRGPSVWIERLSSPINPLPFASPLLSQVAALRSYHTRVCGTDGAHLSFPFGSSTRPLSLCSLRSPRTLHADGAPFVAARSPRSTSDVACVVRRARSLTQALAGR